MQDWVFIGFAKHMSKCYTLPEEGESAMVGGRGGDSWTETCLDPEG